MIRPDGKSRAHAGLTVDLVLVKSERIKAALTKIDQASQGKLNPGFTLDLARATPGTGGAAAESLDARG